DPDRLLLGFEELLDHLRLKFLPLDAYLILAGEVVGHDVGDQREDPAEYRKDQRRAQPVHPPHGSPAAGVRWGAGVARRRRFWRRPFIGRAVLGRVGIVAHRKPSRAPTRAGNNSDKRITARLDHETPTSG